MEARLAEARLADAKLTVTEQVVQLQALSDTPGTAERARAVARAELDLVRKHDVEAAAQGRGKPAAARGAFATLSREALAKNNEQFLALADSRLGEARTAAQGDLAKRRQAIEEMLTPLSETLTRYERGIQLMEVERQGACAGLSERVAALHLGHDQLQKEPQPRDRAALAAYAGSLGRMTLRRAVEAAGMLEHCDFEEQKTVVGEDGFVRPDMIVHLPGGGQVVIDSKVPLEAFLQSSRRTATTPAPPCWRTRRRLPPRRPLAKRSTGSSSTARPSSSSPSSPANRCWRPPSRPTRRCRSTRLNKRIILATPNTLVAALRTRAVLAAGDAGRGNHREVRDLGAELFERLRTWTGHMQALRKNLPRVSMPTTGRSARSVTRPRHGAQVPFARRGRRRARGDH